MLAWAWASVARAMESSKRTRMAPLVMRWPSWKVISAMRPAISGRITTDSLDSSDPTAVTERATAPILTGTASTGIGGMPPGGGPAGFAPAGAPWIGTP
jgi:hypothetical protein